MQILVIPFVTNSQHLNSSLQIGDVIYYSSQSSVVDGGFTTSFNETSPGVSRLGVVVDIDPNVSISVIYDNTIIGCAGCIALPQSGDFIMFGKSKAVNSSNLNGYYMELEFKNYDRNKVELFAVGSEVSESSK